MLNSVLLLIMPVLMVVECISERCETLNWGEGDETHYRNVPTAWYHVTLACRSSDHGVEQGKCQRVWRLINN